MRRSPLRSLTDRTGAHYAAYADFELPANYAYADPDSEYNAALKDAALFDYSHAAKLRLTGPDAPQWLHNICTNIIKDLPLGGGCETFFCDARAKALFIAWVYHVRLADAAHALWVETTPGRGGALLQHLNNFLISEDVEITIVTDQFAQMHLAGSRAKEILETAISEKLPDLGEFQHMERTFGMGATCNIRRRDMLGVPGYDLVCLGERAQGVWRLLASAGAVAAGLDAFERLRIEAGTPVYGVDFDDSRFVMEVGGASRAVSYAKGCFPGQEPIVMARDRAGRVNRKFMGLKVVEGDAVTPGSTLMHDGLEAGTVTSSLAKSKWGVPFSLGYVHWKFVEPGTRLDVSGTKQVVEVNLLNESK